MFDYAILNPSLARCLFCAVALLLFASCSELPLPRFDLLINNEDYPDTRQMTGQPDKPIPGIAPELPSAEPILLLTGLEKEAGYDIQWFVDGMEYPNAAGEPGLSLAIGGTGRHQVRVCIYRGEESRCQEKFFFITAEESVEAPLPPQIATEPRPPINPEQVKPAAQPAVSMGDVVPPPEPLTQRDERPEPSEPIKLEEEVLPAPPPPREYNGLGQVGVRASAYNESCGAAEPRGAAVNLMPEKYLLLSRFSVQATACGLLSVEILGEGVSWRTTQTLTPGRNTISLIGFDQELRPGKSYTLKAMPKASVKCPEGSAAPALGNAKNCIGVGDAGNEILKLSYSNGQVALYDLVYNYAE
ncbi:hypothetical protein [Phaeodactylibacter luteus]|uniref:Uncharacterized protein n=1 Tax=Phaeodactylibacter luteus TaxID=1564516 RepID=A0A5C6S3C3_9BACT|nr:hypothetical protein [Phaeodactylibacter luteus]TXB68310.1 hypothetical protein FRY97_02720 [Phaeodactylibacter luteus]